MSEHAARYARLAGALNAAGLSVWAHDQRGHGHNPTPPVGLGHFGDDHGWDGLVDDVRHIWARLRIVHPALPVVIFGHSMGSFVVQAVMPHAGSDYRGVVLAGSNGPPGALEAALHVVARTERLLRGRHAPARSTGRLVFGAYNRRFAPNRTAFDWLTRDTDEVDRYIADPLCGFPLTTQAWLDLLRGRRSLGRMEHVGEIPKALPILVIGGTRDPVGDDANGLARLLALYARAGLTDVTHHFYASARHELVNEINRDEVTFDLLAWLDRVVGGART